MNIEGASEQVSEKLSHGGNRIVAIEVCCTPPLCICSVYMPSRNSKSNVSDKESYMHCLDQLEEMRPSQGGGSLLPAP